MDKRSPTILMPEAEPFNPYAAPKTVDFSAPVSTDQISFDGECLIIPKKYHFPAICLKSGETEDLVGPRRRKFRWYPPLLALLIIVHFLIFLIVALCVSKKGEIYFHLSREVARKRKNVILRNWGLFALGIALMYFGIQFSRIDSSYVALAGGVCLVATIILSIMASRFLSVKKIDKTHIWLRGIPDHVARLLVAAGPAKVEEPVKAGATLSYDNNVRGGLEY